MNKRIVGSRIFAIATLLSAANLHASMSLDQLRAMAPEAALSPAAALAPLEVVSLSAAIDPRIEGPSFIFVPPVSVPQDIADAALTPADIAGIHAERKQLFLLAAMGYAYASLKVVPQPGYDIAATVVWDIDSTAQTPAFVIERNRNYENQGDIFHAEINTLRAAYNKKRNPNVPPGATPDERFLEYTSNLTNTTLFTTLEPCPMCAATITMAKVPKAVYCMEDPGLRDLATHQLSIVTPTAFYGRKLEQEMTDLPACTAANKTMWQAIDKGPDGKHVFATKDNKSKYIRLTQYITDKGEDIFKPAYESLAAFQPKYTQNQPVLDVIRKAVGKPVTAK